MPFRVAHDRFRRAKAYSSRCVVRVQDAASGDDLVCVWRPGRQPTEADPVGSACCQFDDVDPVPGADRDSRSIGRPCRPIERLIWICVNDAAVGAVGAGDNEVCGQVKPTGGFDSALHVGEPPAIRRPSRARDMLRANQAPQPRAVRADDIDLRAQSCRAYECHAPAVWRPCGVRIRVRHRCGECCGSKERGNHVAVLDAGPCGVDSIAAPSKPFEQGRLSPERTEA